MTITINLSVLIAWYLLTAIGVGAFAWMAIDDKPWITYVLFGLAWIIMLPFLGISFLVIAVDSAGEALRDRSRAARRDRFG